MKCYFWTRTIGHIKSSTKINPKSNFLYKSCISEIVKKTRKKGERCTKITRSWISINKPKKTKSLYKLGASKIVEKTHKNSRNHKKLPYF
jgi:hypothetical protein